MAKRKPGAPHKGWKAADRKRHEQRADGRPLAAFRCRCPDKDCTNWRTGLAHGGGHVTYDQALELLAPAYAGRLSSGSRSRIK